MSFVVITLVLAVLLCLDGPRPLVAVLVAAFLSYLLRREQAASSP